MKITNSFEIKLMMWYYGVSWATAEQTEWSEDEFNRAELCMEANKVDPEAWYEKEYM